MHWKIPSAIICLIWISAFLSCEHDSLIEDMKPDPVDSTEMKDCDPDSIYFEMQVLPILISNCTKSGCHNSASAQNGVILTNYANVLATTEVDPEDFEKSEIYKKIIESDPEKRMPPPSELPLEQEAIDVISSWLAQGAKDLSCNPVSTSCDTIDVSFSLDIKPVIDVHCRGCHSGPQPPGGIDLTTYTNIAAEAVNGKLMGAISREPGFVPMPRGGNKLDLCSINKFQAWIDAGAPDN